MNTTDTCPHTWTYPRPGVRECINCAAVELLPHDGELERAPVGDTDRDWMRTRWNYSHMQSGEKSISFHFEDSHVVGYDIGKTSEEREQ